MAKKSSAAFVEPLKIEKKPENRWRSISQRLKFGQRTNENEQSRLPKQVAGFEIKVSTNEVPPGACHVQVSFEMQCTIKLDCILSLTYTVQPVEAQNLATSETRTSRNNHQVALFRFDFDLPAVRDTLREVPVEQRQLHYDILGSVDAFETHAFNFEVTYMLLFYGSRKFRVRRQIILPRKKCLPLGMLSGNVSRAWSGSYCDKKSSRD